MLRRSSTALVFALLLLAHGTGTTVAAHHAAPHGRLTDSARAGLMTTVTRYFAAVNLHQQDSRHPDMLDRLYAPGITVTESLTAGWPRLHTGLQQVRNFDRLNTLSWSVLSARTLSPTLVLTSERPFVMGPGHELNQAQAWSTLFTIRNARIVSLVWRPLYQTG